MKKSITMILLILLCLFIVEGCSKSEKTYYESMLADVTLDGITKVETECDYWTGIYLSKEGMQAQTCVAMGSSYTGEYRQSIVDKLNSYTTDFYRTDSGIDFGLRSDTGQLIFINFMTRTFFDTVPYLPDVENTEESALSIAQSVASQYVSDIQHYERQPIQISQQDKEKDGVTHTITYYLITYAKKVQGYNSSDYISIKVSSKGTVCTIYMGDIGVFDTLSSEINNDLVEDSVLEKTKALYKNTEYTFVNCTINDQKIAVTPDGDFVIYSSVDVQLELENDRSFGTKIYIITRVA